MGKPVECLEVEYMYISLVPAMPMSRLLPGYILGIYLHVSAHVYKELGSRYLHVSSFT